MVCQKRDRGCAHSSNYFSITPFLYDIDVNGGSVVTKLGMVWSPHSYADPGESPTEVEDMIFMLACVCTEHSTGCHVILGKVMLGTILCL